MSALTPWLDKLPLVAILRGVRPEEAVALAETLAAHRFSIIEVPMNSPQPLDSIARLAKRFGARLLIGAGTVTEPAQVAAIEQAGGKLIVMPHADARVVKRAKSLGLLALPGFATPTEAFAMLAAGADGLKLFPAEANPPHVLRALRAVLPKDIPILPVGSITPDNMAAYVDAGANGFGLGSALYRAGDSPQIVASKAASFAAAVR